jgi:hypothetical protein
MPFPTNIALPLRPMIVGPRIAGLGPSGYAHRTESLFGRKHLGVERLQAVFPEAPQRIGRAQGD